MQSQIKKKQFYKRHFQLLELMVAAFILLICIAPTMKIFTNIYKSQKEIIRINQRDHLAHLVHAKFTEQLYKRTIPLKDIDVGNPIILKDVELNEFLQKYFFDYSGTFFLKPHAKKGESPDCYLCELKIEIIDTLIKPKEPSGDHQSNGISSTQNSAVGTYDYSIFIDTVAVSEDNKPKDNKQNQHLEADDEEEDEDDDDDDDEDEDEDDGDEDEDATGG